MLGCSMITKSSRKQEITTLSTTKAKYVAATSSACQVVWLKRLFKDIGQIQVETTEIFHGNRSTISITKNPTMHGRTKHMDIWFHFIRGLVADGKITLKHYGTNEQLIDIFTKPLSVHKHNYLKSMQVFVALIQGGVEG